MSLSDYTDADLASELLVRGYGDDTPLLKVFATARRIERDEAVTKEAT